jgi:hypothetical protein
VKTYSRILGTVPAEPGFQVVEIHMSHDAVKAFLTHYPVIAWVTVRYEKDEFADRVDCIEAAYLDTIVGEIQVTDSQFNSERLIAGPGAYVAYIERNHDGIGGHIEFYDPTKSRPDDGNV